MNRPCNIFLISGNVTKIRRTLTVMELKGNFVVPQFLLSYDLDSLKFIIENLIVLMVKKTVNNSSVEVHVKHYKLHINTCCTISYVAEIGGL